MAYTDLTLIREKSIRIRLNEREERLIDALIEYTGQQKSTVIREMILEQARLVLSGQADYAPNRFYDEAPAQASVAQR